MTLALLILKLVIMIVVPVLASILTYLLKKYVDKLIIKIDDKNTQAALLQGVELIADSVNYVQQTYVDELKKNNSFTIDEQKKALQKAYDRALELMNEDIQNAILDSYGDIDKYVKTIIESVIKENK